MPRPKFEHTATDAEFSQGLMATSEATASNRTELSIDKLVEELEQGTGFTAVAMEGPINPLNILTLGAGHGASRPVWITWSRFQGHGEAATWRHWRTYAFSRPTDPISLRTTFPDREEDFELEAKRGFSSVTAAFDLSNLLRTLVCGVVESDGEENPNVGTYFSVDGSYRTLTSLHKAGFTSAGQINDDYYDAKYFYEYAEDMLKDGLAKLNKKCHDRGSDFSLNVPITSRPSSSTH